MLTLEKAAPPALILDPPFGTNSVDTPHTVTLIYKIGGVPQDEVPVEIEIIDGPNTGVFASGVTDDNGEFPLMYIGSGGVGMDTIVGRVLDAPGGSVILSSTATKTWIENGGVPPQVPGITGWGIMAAGIILVALIPLVLRRRKLSSTSG